MFVIKETVALSTSVSWMLFIKELVTVVDICN
jgi:hypothetical protein